MSIQHKMAQRLADLPFLLAERPRSQKELMDHFAADRKTIKAMIDASRGPHEILEERDGREIKYRMANTFKNPNFTPSELAILLLAQEAIGATGLTAISSPFAPHVRSLLKKVRTALQASLHPRLDALAGVFGSAITPAKNFTPHAEHVERLTNAAIERQRILMRYHTLHSGETTERKFDPYAVYFDPDGATIKVIGYDHIREKIIPFSIDHIQRFRETGERFTRPENWTLRDHLTRYCFNGIHGDPVKVRLRAYGVTASIFAERTFHDSQDEIDRFPENSSRPDWITIEMEVADGRGLDRFILSWSPDIEVVSPPEIRRRVNDALRRSIERNLVEE
ncbi:MAG: WYL domain-containing protein [Acidobacteriota bacterium]|nr:MAG: WYL domain-containing protein [Acidobacteriota bacterium]